MSLEAPETELFIGKLIVVDKGSSTLSLFLLLRLALPKSSLTGLFFF